jgi:XTP/dITP diphosphohydrolase
LEDIGCYEEILETADTIEGNSVLKANYVTEKYYDCFADDTDLK